MLKVILSSAEETETCFVLVHGTFARNLSWLSPESILIKTLRSVASSADIFGFSWDGCPRQASRFNASRELTNALEKLRAKYRRCFVIGHSHGGNIGLQAIQSVSSNEIHLITLATPFLRTRWTDPRNAITQLSAPLLTLFLWSALAGIFWYAWRTYEVPTTACLIAVVVFIAALFLFFRARDWIGTKAETRRRPYFDLTVHYPLKMLVLYLENDEVIDVIFRPLQSGFKRIIGASSDAKARAMRAPGRLEALKPMRLVIALFCLGVGLAVSGVDALYVMLVFTVMAFALVIYLAPTAMAATWSVTTSTVASAFWPFYSAFQSGNVIDPFFVLVRVRDKPRIQPGCGTAVTTKPVHLKNDVSVFARVAKRTFLHTAICKSEETMREIADW